MKVPNASMFVVVVLLLLLVLVGQAPRVESVTCDPSQLSSCAGAIFSSNTPTAECCSKLRQQQPCFCQYLRNPSLRQYINSPNGRRVAASCRTPFPRC